MRQSNDTQRDRRVARAAAECHGVLSLAELFACGLDHNAIARRCASGRLHRLYPGVYAVGHDNPPRSGHLLAAVKACGDGALLSHWSAAMHWGLLPWHERRIDVTVVGGRRVVEGVRVHRTSTLERPDRRRHDGVPVTSPARTIVDLAGSATPKALRRATREAQGRFLASVPEILRVVERSGRKRGVRALRAIVSTGPAPTRSELEDVVLDLLLTTDLPHPDVNEPLHLDGRKVIPDFRWPDLRLVVEADGAAWHDDKLAREDDAERQALLEQHGEHVLRVTWDQAVARPAQTANRVLRAAASR
jgi:hypothetical protein